MLFFLLLPVRPNPLMFCTFPFLCFSTLLLLFMSTSITYQSQPPFLLSLLFVLSFHFYHPLFFMHSFISIPIPSSAAVQEERQRNKEREGEVESTSAVNEEMPVEKILEAEMAVEQKTELHADGSSGGSSVSSFDTRNCQQSGFLLGWRCRY